MMVPAFSPSMDSDDTGAASTSQQQLLAQTTVNNLTKRKRSEATPTDINIDALTFDPNRQNRFSILAGIEIENVPKTTSPGEKVSVGPGTQTSKAFCPPIFLYNTNIKSLVEQLEAKTPKIVFKIRNVSKHKSKIYFADVTVHQEMMALLRKNGIHSYSFTPKEYKQVSIVLRGLYFGMQAEEVKSALDKAVPDVVDKVSKFSTPFSKKKNVDTGLFLVSLSPGKTLSDVSNIKYLLSQTITWETPNNKKLEIQCHRCQRFGHISKNCNSEYKCVKCDQKHAPGECLYQKSETSLPFCVNCGQTGHPASWRGCQTYKDYVKSRKERMAKARMEKDIAAVNVKSAISSSYRLPGKSFSSLFQQKTSNDKVQQKPSVINDFLQLAKYFLEPEELTIEQEINIFLAEFHNMPRKDAKSEFLRILNKVKTNYGP